MKVHCPLSEHFPVAKKFTGKNAGAGISRMPLSYPLFYFLALNHLHQALKGRCAKGFTIGATTNQ